jgi:hypothetical protein
LVYLTGCLTLAVSWPYLTLSNTLDEAFKLLHGLLGTVMVNGVVKAKHLVSGMVGFCGFYGINLAEKTLESRV